MAFDFIEKSSVGSGFVYKNTTGGYYMNGAQFTATTGTGTSVMNISAVTSGIVTVGMTLTGGTLSGTTTITSFGTFNGTSGTVNLSGTDSWANPTTVIGTGFVQITDPDYPSETVRGIVYLDGTYYVMTPGGAIHGSDINDPSSWSALNVIQCQIEPDTGVALSRISNLIVAFGAYSTEFFYDAGNPTGSPLLPYANAALEMGCATGDSVATSENVIFFMGVTRQMGRGIYVLSGVTPTKVSTPFIDRILDADDLSDVSAFCIKLNGHLFYILYLGNVGKTLVLDANVTTGASQGTTQSSGTATGYWQEWTQTTAQTPVSVATLSCVNTTVSVFLTSHGLSSGDVITISGATPSGYNVTNALVNVLNSSTFTYEVASDPVLYTSGAMMTVYTEAPFSISSYISTGDLNLIQDSTTGNIYSMSSSVYSDNGNPIKFSIRTPNIDFGNNNKKFYASAQLIGDKVDSKAFIRYTNDDYQTYSSFRPVDLSSQRSIINRLGQSRRRAWDIRSYENQPVRLEALEVTVEEGVK